MRTERFDFEGADGQRLSGLLDLPEIEPRAHAIFAHCFTCTKNSLAASRISRALADRGFAVLRYDFTGLGESDGEFASSTFTGSIRDLVAAAAAMAAAGREPHLLVGHSFGGAAVLAAAGQLPGVRAVSTIAAPFEATHLEHLFRDGLEALQRDGEATVDIGGRPFRIRRSLIDDLEGHDQAQRIAELRRPLLVAHAPRDAVVGIDNASQIFLAAKHPKSFLSLDDADHLLTRAADADYVAEVISAWASRYVGGPLPALRSQMQTGEVVVEETGVGDYQVEVHAGAARFLADEPPEVGGMGTGPTPYDILCASLGACTAITVRMYARRKGWPLENIRVSVGHVKDPAQTPHDEFSRKIALDGPLTPEQRARMLEIAGHCPVHRTLEAGSRVITAFADEPAAVPPAENPVQHALDAEAVNGKG
ncbi:MAG: alpha/beta fold hydrolase [Caulobacteraceae bacterium]|nr:alpha/beta fold hydrolase [Caulobacteraceae bacterium]